MPDTPLTPAYVHGVVSSALYEYDISAEAARHILDELDSSLTRYIAAITAEHDACVEKVGHSLTCPRAEEPHDA